MVSAYARYNDQCDDKAGVVLKLLSERTISAPTLSVGSKRYVVHAKERRKSIVC